MQTLSFTKKRKRKKKSSSLKPISKTIQVKRTTRCLRRKDELISDVVLWTPTHERASVEEPARIYLHQLFADTGVVRKIFRERLMIGMDGEGKSQGNLHCQCDLMMMMLMMYVIPKHRGIK